jgi:hypothetical protein
MKIKGIIFMLFALSFNTFAQNYLCDNKNINEAFKLALNTIDINIRRGILAAGGDYGGEWTRDIAINSWNCVSLLDWEVAERSLWSVTNNKTAIGHQYWDHILWVIAALNHYKVTGNKEFLREAYYCSKNTMKALEDTVFDSEFGLFTGPSVFNDGIAGYPAPIYDSTNLSSYVLDHTESKYIKCLSTNCVYYGAYLALLEMSRILNLENDIQKNYVQKSANLKKNILEYLYNKKENKFYYFIDKNGKKDKSQEGLGIAFAVLFGIIDHDISSDLIKEAVTSEFGITSIYPDFERFSKEKPGRHNNIIWPMVNGFFANAAILAGNKEAFIRELKGLTRLALDEDKGDYNFREIYNPYTGKPDGGWQQGEGKKEIHWYSCKYQTWSATAYISMILYGIIGMRFENDTISFSPFIPPDFGNIKLTGIKYRNSILNISIKGKGDRIKSFALDGKNQDKYIFNPVNEGTHKIYIEME